MGQEVAMDEEAVSSLALVPIETAPSTSGVDNSEGLMGGRSEGVTSRSSICDDEIYASCSGKSSKGLVGLYNLGNTCFMNSALQCLAHTPELVDFFLQDYSREINRANPLGMEGELAEAFGELIRMLWTSEKAVVAPRAFKAKLSHFAPQFGGYNQHDSQELLAFLLDGLHEDLNRVKCKPYIEAKDGDGRPDEEVADEYWANHRARNDSVIVDLFQGQYKSTLVCPSCNKVSVTFDPFMYLSLPLPAPKGQVVKITLKLFDWAGLTPPAVLSVPVQRTGRFKDLCQAIATACGLQEDETLMLIEVYNYHIFRVLGDNQAISSLDENDRVAAYRLRKSADKLCLYHGTLDENARHSRWSFFGSPLITCLPDEDLSDGAELYNVVEKVIAPFKKETEKSMLDRPFQIYLTDEKGKTAGSLIEPAQLLPPGFSSTRDKYLLLEWSESGMNGYDFSKLDVPPVSAAELDGSRRQRTEAVSLYSCLEAFLKEEPLGPDDMWYCPGCKEHRQASKKLDLWRLPEILVVHLKRFSYTRTLKNKLEVLVDFPIHGLDLSKYVSESVSDLYDVYAVSNHYGSMGGGHYTAYAKLCDDNKWYTFDDSNVSPIIQEDGIKTSAAYVLFYRRRRTAENAANNGRCC